MSGHYWRINDYFCRGLGLFRRLVPNFYLTNSVLSQRMGVEVLKNVRRLPACFFAVLSRGMGLVALFLLLGSHGLLANSPPVAVDDESYAYENQMQSGNVSLNDYDPDGDPLTFTVLIPPNHGILVMQPNGQFTYTPNPYYYGFDFATYQVCDPHGACATAQIELATLFVNDPPVINDETFYIVPGQSFTGSVAANDYDLDNEPIFYSVIAPPNNVVSYSLSLFGIVTLTPQPGFTGTIVLVYQGCDPCDVCGVGMAIFIVAPNNPPVALNDSATTPMNTPVSGNVALNDSDPDGHALTFSIVTPPSSGSLQLNSNGTFTYTPAPFFHGVVNAVYRTCDIFNSCTAATLTITVQFVNFPPVAQNDSFVMDEDAVLQGNVSTNDSDPNGEALVFTLTQPPAVGVMNLNSSTGQFSYTPPANWFGQVVAQYQACDPHGACAQASVTIVVNPVNDPPVAQDVSIALDEDTSFSGSLTPYASDVDGDALVFAVVSGPQHGVLSLNSQGSFVYTPTPDYSGLDSFQYSVCDGGGLCAVATVSITVYEVNDPPVVVGELFEMNEDEQLLGDVGLNDFDPEGAVLTFQVVTPPAHGALILNSSGSFSYIPQANFFGSDQFVYQACDPIGSCTQGIAVIKIQPVNDAPVAQNASISLDEDTSISGSLAAFASDVDNDVLTFSVVSGPLNGTLSLTPQGSFIYTPNPDYSGLDSFQFSVCDDGGLCASAIVSITIHEVNDAPVVLSESFGVNEDELLEGHVGLNDFDPEGAVLTYQVLGPPLHGSLVLSQSGTFSYLPDANFFGNDQFTYQACDPEGLCGVGTATIVIHSVNDSPVANDDNFEMLEDGILNSDISQNDFDVDGDLLSYSIVSLPVSGNLILHPNGQFTYTPIPDFHGTVTFSYLACDPHGACDQALVTIVVLPVNDAPVASGETYTMNEDTVLNGTVAGNDYDVDGDPLTYSVLQGPAQGIFSLQANGSFTFTPPLNYHGLVNVTYTVCDPHGACDQAILSITVLPVNDSPVVNGETFSVLLNTPISGNLAANDFDVDGDVLTYTLVAAPESGQLVVQPNGLFTFTPDEDVFGTLTAIYSACDPSNACGTATLTLNVLLVNSTPVASDEVFTGPEDMVLLGDAGLNDSDPDGHTLVYELVQAPAVGEFALSANGAFEFTPPADWNGTTTAVYSACDQFNACDQATVTLIIIPVNDPPVVVGEVMSTMEDEPLEGTVADNDFDVDGDVLTYLVLEGPQNGTIVMEIDGTFIYTPYDNYFGTEVVVYQACDPDGLCGIATLTIHVIFVNDPPVALDDFYDLPINGVVSGNVGDNDIEIDPEPLTYSLIQDVSNGLLTFNPDGSFVYVANDGFSGTDIAMYSACDPCGACDVATIYFFVGAINSPPFAGDVEEEVCALNAWNFDLDAVVFDFEDPNSALQFTLISGDQGEWIINPITHVVSFIPNENASGTAEAQYSVCDQTMGPECSFGQITLFLSEPVTPQILHTEVSPVRCHGESSGSIDVLTDDYLDLIEWTNGETGNSITGLLAGIYSAEVSRPGACAHTVALQFEVVEPGALEVEGLGAIHINGSAGGSSDFTVSGGTEPYSFVWVDLDSGEIVSEAKILSNLTDPSQAGNYQLVITDANGCELTSEIMVTGLSELGNATPYSLAPNPAGSEIWLLAGKTHSGVLDLHVFDVSGRIIYTSLKNILGPGERKMIPLSGMSAGTYILRIDVGQQVHQVKFEKF